MKLKMPTSILLATTTHVNLRTKVLKHALMLIGEPIDQISIIPQTLAHKRFETIMDLLNALHSILEELSIPGTDKQCG